MFALFYLLQIQESKEERKEGRKGGREEGKKRGTEEGGREEGREGKVNIRDTSKSPKSHLVPLTEK